MQKLISIELKSDFGFLRKPDVNSGINFSYNMLHKPALLGILGSIIGLGGYSQAKEEPNNEPLKKGQKPKIVFPQYYQILKNVPIGIAPIDNYHDKGNFSKTVIKYSNTIGYANKGENYLTEEATLIKPCFKIYLLLELEEPSQNKLYQYLKEGKTEFIPYLGKNEFPVWWDKQTVEEYEFERVETISDLYQITTLFEKKSVIKGNNEQIFDLSNIQNSQSAYIYFERLPKCFDEDLVQYQLGDFVYTTFSLTSGFVADNLYLLNARQQYVQLH